MDAEIHVAMVSVTSRSRRLDSNWRHREAGRSGRCWSVGGSVGEDRARDDEHPPLDPHGRHRPADPK